MRELDAYWEVGLTDEELKSLVNVNPGWIDLTGRIHLNITYPARLSREQFNKLSWELAELPDQYLRKIFLSASDYSDEDRAYFLISCSVRCEVVFI